MSLCPDCFIRVLVFNPLSSIFTFQVYITALISCYLGIAPYYPNCDPASSPDLDDYYISSTTPQYERCLILPSPPRPSVMVVDAQNDGHLLLSPSH